MRRLIALLFAAFCSAAGAQLPAGCEGDASLTGRTDVALCEAFESSTWWQNGYKEDGSKTNPPPASSAESTEIVSSGCVSGNCLQGNYPACTPGGPSASGVLAHHQTIPGNLEEVYLRYYIKLASNFAQPFYSTLNCSTFANDHSGKFPGVGDVRPGSDGTAPPPSTAVGQCGNGGDVSDGLWCWWARKQYRNCISSTSVGDEPYTTGQDICEQDIHGKTAQKRCIKNYSKRPKNRETRKGRKFGEAH